MRTVFLFTNNSLYLNLHPNHNHPKNMDITKLSRILLFIGLFAILNDSLTLAANSETSYSFSVTKKSNKESHFKRGTRTPGITHLCVITADLVTIIGAETEPIILYEIKTTDEIVLYIGASSAEFIRFFNSLDEDAIITLTTNNHTWIGTIGGVL